MHKLSDFEIDKILDSVSFWYKHWKGVKTRDEMIELIKKELKSDLLNSSSGLKENVCDKCLGTGYSQPKNVI